MATWSNSFRLMLGSLPLVEYFFGYPGMGRILVQSIGIHYGVGTDFARPIVYRGDIAIGLVVILALLQLVLIAVALYGFNQNWHVEEERPIGYGEDYGAGASPDDGAPLPA